MWLVRIALSRPYTFIVAGLLILILGVLTVKRTPTDVFPSIKVPVVGIVWNYSGLQPQEMADRIVNYYERWLTTTVSNVEHIESQSLHGVAVVKVYFHPTVDPNRALAEIAAVSQTVLRYFPAGTTPPLILSYDASSVPILQLALSSPSLLESQLFDAGNNFMRSQLATVQGAGLPFPYGGKQRQIQVDLDPRALQSQGVSAHEVGMAVVAQNVLLPAGTQKLGALEFDIVANTSPATVAELNDIPVKVRHGTVVYLRDVGHVRDGYPPQTNIARVEGRRAVLMSVIKTGNASTLDIIRQVKELLPFIQSGLPKDIAVHPIGDQSIFVRAAVSGVLLEAVLAALLTGLMILLFLGSLRSTCIILVSIPLALMAAVMGLAALGQTINIMTLGGMALAVGILVDDATVTLESINYHLERGADVRTAILSGADQIAKPAFVSTLAICIVFMPMFLLTGVSRYLFVPMAEAVVFAMLASYMLSRTLVPTLASYLLSRGQHASSASAGALTRFHQRFESGFASVRARYQQMLETVVLKRTAVVLGVLAFSFLSLGLLGPRLGQNFFPHIDAGQIKLHLRAPSGLRIEETAALCDAVERVIRRTIPERELDSLVDIEGLPYSGISMLYSNSAPIGAGDADVFISLKSGHGPVEAYERKLRGALNESFPGTTFWFLPADIVTQILNFGLPGPIAVGIVGRDLEANRAYAAKLIDRLRQVPGLTDLRLHQTFDYPQLQVKVDRIKAAQLGLTEQDVADNLLTSLSGTVQTEPTFWADRRSGVEYPISTQVPQYWLQDLQGLQGTLVNVSHNSAPVLLSSVASLVPAVGPGVVSDFNAQRALDVYASVTGTDLGSVGAQVRKIISETAPLLPKGSKVVLRGQVETMQATYTELFGGFALALVLIYLLMVVNFQSWLDPLIMIATLPAAAAGMVWLLFLTGTTLSVPALTGAIVCIGVATANSILLVSFAREQIAEGVSAPQAIVQAALVRLRPVLMTAGAMIVGMIPIALGVSEGGEQNAPLGRVVVGGLLAATVATLVFVPALFALIHGPRHPARSSLTSHSSGGGL